MLQGVFQGVGSDGYNANRLLSLLPFLGRDLRHAGRLFGIDKSNLFLESAYSSLPYPTPRITINDLATMPK